MGLIPARICRECGHACGGLCSEKRVEKLEKLLLALIAACGGTDVCLLCGEKSEPVFPHHHMSNDCKCPVATAGDAFAYNVRKMTPEELLKMEEKRL